MRNFRLKEHTFSLCFEAGFAAKGRKPGAPITKLSTLQKALEKLKVSPSG